MRFQGERIEPFTKLICCDRCGRRAELGDPEFEEMICINRRAGYASVFGDGKDVQLDLCQHCLKSILGPWLRVNDPGVVDPMADLLQRFDPDRHGGEFPPTRDRSLIAPDDMPIQERGAIEADRLGHADAQVFLPAEAQDLELLADQVFSTTAEAKAWLGRAHPLLEDRTPLELAQDPSGKQRVVDLLVATKFGGAA